MTVHRRSLARWPLRLRDGTEDRKWDLETGPRVQERAQFYSLTLSFTLLALAVQSAEISDDELLAVLESFGALALLISGLSGLWRALDIPGLYKIQVHLRSLHENLDDAKEIEEKGAPLIYSPLLEKSFKIDGYIDEHDKNVRHFVEKTKKLESKLSTFVWFHRYGLLTGILVIMAARVFVPTYRVFYG